MTVRAPIAVALDAPDVETAAQWAQAVTPHVQVVKIGLELFCRTGPSIVETVRGASGVDLFLDLKLHDIPNTVAGAARGVAKLRPRYLTVHATGGADMVKAAVRAPPDVTIAAVTVLLTYMSADVLDAVRTARPLIDAVRRLAALAVGAGAGALVCSPQEVAAVRIEWHGHRAHHAGSAPGRRRCPGPGRVATRGRPFWTGPTSSSSTTPYHRRCRPGRRRSRDRCLLADHPRRSPRSGVLSGSGCTRLHRDCQVWGTGIASKRPVSLGSRGLANLLFAAPP